FGDTVSCMYEREYTLQGGLDLYATFGEEEFPRAVIEYIEHSSLMTYGKTYDFNRYIYCWNSGVLALSRDFFKFMPDVCRLTDAFYKNTRWFISEQLALSFILSVSTRIEPAKSMVFHYWGKRQKSLIDSLISSEIHTWKQD